jgi:hypothetical protein
VTKEAKKKAGARHSDSDEKPERPDQESVTRPRIAGRPEGGDDQAAEQPGGKQRDDDTETHGAVRRSSRTPPPKSSTTA